MVMRIK